MTGVKPEEAERFYEEDEDPARVFALFDAGQEGQTTRPGRAEPPPVSGKLAALRQHIATALHRVADLIEPPGVARTGKRQAIHKSS
jgi:hypothetical protein